MKRLAKEDQSVSVIINVYNEAATLEKEIREIHNQIVRRLPGSELIVAEDGSTDGTKRIIKSLADELGVIHSTGPERKGYARAFKDALGLAKNPYIFFSDTGDKFDWADFWKLYAKREGNGLVIGVRVGREDQRYRRVLTWGYNYLVRKYFKISLRDADSGFRLYEQGLVKRLVSSDWIYRDLIGSELAIKARYMGYTVQEVPIKYRQRKSVSRGLPPRKIPRAIINAIKNASRLKKQLATTDGRRMVRDASSNAGKHG